MNHRFPSILVFFLFWGMQVVSGGPFDLGMAVNPFGNPVNPIGPSKNPISPEPQSGGFMGSAQGFTIKSPGEFHSVHGPYYYDLSWLTEDYGGYIEYGEFWQENGEYLAGVLKSVDLQDAEKEGLISLFRDHFRGTVPLKNAEYRDLISWLVKVAEDSEASQNQRQTFLFHLITEHVFDPDFSIREDLEDQWEAWKHENQ